MEIRTRGKERGSLIMIIIKIDLRIPDSFSGIV